MVTMTGRCRQAMWGVTTLQVGWLCPPALSPRLTFQRKATLGAVARGEEISIEMK